MAKLVCILAALCFASLLVSAYSHDGTYHIEGKVYCDTCRAAFETTISEHIPGAQVKLECRDRANANNITFLVEGETDAAGTYSLLVSGEHEEEICEVILVSSPRTDCDEKLPSRDRARILVTNNAGIISPVRFANTLGFLKKQPLADCPKLLALMGILPQFTIPSPLT